MACIKADILKEGDILVCINDNSDNEDLGSSGIVLYGRKDMKENKEYTFEHIVAVKTKEDDPNKDYWTQIKVKEIMKPVWLCDFKLKK